MTPNRNTHWRRYSRYRRRRRNGRGGLSEVGVVAVSGNSKFLLDDTLPTNERTKRQPSTAAKGPCRLLTTCDFATTVGVTRSSKE